LTIITPVRSFKKDLLSVNIYESRLSLSRAAAADVAARMRERLAEKEWISMVFAPAASATDFIAALVEMRDIAWERVIGFHLDEYIGPNKQKIGAFAKTLLFDRVPFREVHYLNGGAADIDAECARYADLLRQYPLDIACIGIGENGHLAYNEPHNADFNDPAWVKRITLDDVSRAQAVKDGTFAALDEVPDEALTMTIPAICAASEIFVVVPDERKCHAVQRTLTGEIAETCPASYLRKCEHSRLYLDLDSASLLQI
jgi:glucosamine-6-phosphate deaminase